MAWVFRTPLPGLPLARWCLVQDLSSFAGAVVGDDPNAGILDESLKSAKEYTESFKSQEIRAKEAELQRMISDPAYDAGDVLGYLKDNPSVAIQMGVEAIPGTASMAVGAGWLAKANTVRKFIGAGEIVGGRVGASVAEGLVAGGIEGVQVAGGTYRETESGEAARLLLV